MSRIYTRDELAQARKEWRNQGKRLVLTNGCFDILHPGHIRLLEQAKDLGDILIVAVNTDASTQRLKGPRRPLNNEMDRARLLQSLACVDGVILFPEDTPRELVSAVMPDVLVKGADWSGFVAGREEVEAAGGEVRLIALEPGQSTTHTVEAILGSV